MTQLKYRIPALVFAAASFTTALACTSLIVTKGATKDGSVMITYAADSHTLYGDMPALAAADHKPGDMRKIYDWDTGKFLGEIPQPAHTYSRIGHINENGVAMAESTWGGHEELVDTAGIIDYGSLIYITLERARTAREAVDIMTSLVQEYGYASEGESFSIADPNEAWIVEMIGKGPGRRGAVWVARRIPDGYISGHANNPRIHKFPLNEPGTTLYSPDVISFAREKGYFSGKDEDFDFSRAYMPYDYLAYRGCDGRVWSYFNRFAPEAAAKSLNWVMEGQGEPMELWVKPDSLISLTDMQWMMRDHFEGTPMDMTKDIGAGPFDVPYRWRPMEFTVDSVEYFHERAIATQQTGFSFVAQCDVNAPEGMKATLWFGADDANTTVYSPVYSCMTEVPHCFEEGNGDMYTISRDAAFWAHNMVANQAYNRYSQMIPDIRKVQTNLEDTNQRADAVVRNSLKGKPITEQKEVVTKISHDLANNATKKFFELNDFLTVKFLDGNIKKQNPDGSFLRTETGLPAQPEYGGYNQRYFREIVKENGDRLKVRNVK
ncbi:MAG: C69 family dipeptidase [Bacteroides sp.]|nr:C69 family dipeptidase [Bacteroides sp.]MCM1379755.1 C69 family dipeptidase [Bacteroides sp.]MCM1445704.1 C69 family dipeptidase [Prevotella sp.]